MRTLIVDAAQAAESAAFWGVEVESGPATEKMVVARPGNSDKNGSVGVDVSPYLVRTFRPYDDGFSLPCVGKNA